MNVPPPTTITIGSLVQKGTAEIKTGPFGTQLHASDYVEQGTPVINVRNIGFGSIREAELEYINEETVARLSSHLLGAGDIVFGRKGAVERHAFLGELHSRWFQGSDCIRLRISDPAVNPRFVSYCLLREEHRRWIQQQCSHGATMASLNQEIVSRIQVPAFSRRQQDRIADILSPYDDLIENNRKRVKVLEEMARTLYFEWFVNFRFPGQEKVKVASTPLGKVPVGWRRCYIQELVDAGSLEITTGPFGTQLRASDYVEEGTPVINVRNIGFGHIRADKLEFIAEATVTRLSQHVLRNGDIVFGRKGAVERHVLIRRAQAGWFQGSDCLRLRVVTGSGLSPVVLSQQFLTPDHKTWMMNQCSHGATMASLNQAIIGRIVATIAPPMVLAAVEQQLRALDGLMERLREQADVLRAARDLLLPRLVSGDLAVPT